MTQVVFGKTTGSLINGLHAKATRGQPVPEVGMGVTFLGWTDRYPGTIREVFTKGAFLYIACSSDDYKRIDDNGFSECQTYEYDTTDNGGRTYYRRKLADGPDARFTGCSKSSETGRFKKNGNSIRIGEREKYHDFCF